MCTVSIIPLGAAPGGNGGSFRVVCNRDESRRRVAAAPPRWRGTGSPNVRAMWPMDLEAGGTWIGVSQRGVCLSLLNLNLDPQPPLPHRARSRGLVIPELLDSADPASAVRRVSGLPLARFAPFRLIVVGATSAGKSATGVHLAEATWDGRSLGITWHDDPPVCFASSGLGDAMVAPRLDLFEDLVVMPGAAAERQDEFHRHAWADRPEISVMMSRSDARTVSVTMVEVVHGCGGSGDAAPRVSMLYEAVAQPAISPAAALAGRYLR